MGSRRASVSQAGPRCRGGSGLLALPSVPEGPQRPEVSGSSGKLPVAARACCRRAAVKCRMTLAAATVATAQLSVTLGRLGPRRAG